MEDNSEDSHKCPVCLEIPETEIYQCKFGHIVCRSCSRSLFACPQCRVAFESPKIRNRALEAMLDKMTFDCNYQFKGCKIKVKRSEITRHAEICSYGEYVLKFCELLGYTCDFKMSIQRIPAALNHFLECHHLAICHDTDIDIRLEGISDFKQNRKSMWYPVVIDLERQHGAKFLLLTLYHEVEQSISIICLILSDTDNPNESMSSNEFRAEFYIKTTKIENAADLVWTVMPIPIKHAAHAIKNKLYTFPLDLLRNYYVKDGTLLLRCSIIDKISDTRLPILNAATLCAFNVPMTSKTPKKVITETNKERLSDTQTLFFGCDNCENTVDALPYRCLQCVKFHICEECMEQGAHGQHIFAKFRSFRHEYAIGKKLNWKWGSFFPSPLTLGESGNRELAKCLECNNKLVSYACMQCNPGSGYCDTCFGNYKDNHTRDHFFAVVKSERRLRLVIENHPLRHGN